MTTRSSTLHTGLLLLAAALAGCPDDDQTAGGETTPCETSADCDGARWMMVAFEKGAGPEKVTRAKVKGPADRMKIK